MKLKSILFIALMSVMFCGYAYADSTIHYTKKNWAGCLSKSDLDRILTYQTQGDTSAIQKMLDARRCFLVKEDLPVYLVESGLTVIRIRPKGHNISLYMLREALK